MNWTHDYELEILHLNPLIMISPRQLLLMCFCFIQSFFFIFCKKLISEVAKKLRTQPLAQARSVVGGLQRELSMGWISGEPTWIDFGPNKDRRSRVWDCIGHRSNTTGLKPPGNKHTKPEPTRKRPGSFPSRSSLCTIQIKKNNNIIYGHFHLKAWQT